MSAGSVGSPEGFDPIDDAQASELHRVLMTAVALHNASTRDPSAPAAAQASAGALECVVALFIAVGRKGLLYCIGAAMEEASRGRPIAHHADDGDAQAVLAAGLRVWAAQPSATDAAAWRAGLGALLETLDPVLPTDLAPLTTGSLRALDLGEVRPLMAPVARPPGAKGARATRRDVATLVWTEIVFTAALDGSSTDAAILKATAVARPGSRNKSARAGQVAAKVPRGTDWDALRRLRRHADPERLTVAKEAGEALRNSETASMEARAFLKWREERGPLSPADLQKALALARKSRRTAG